MADGKTFKALELALHHRTDDAEANQAFRVARQNIKRDGLTFSDFVKGGKPAPAEQKPSKEGPTPAPRSTRSKPQAAKDANKPVNVTLLYPKEIYTLKTARADAQARFEKRAHLKMHYVKIQGSWVFSTVPGMKALSEHTGMKSEKIGADKDIRAVYW